MAAVSGIQPESVSWIREQHSDLGTLYHDKVSERLGRIPLLIVDEFGYIPFVASAILTLGLFVGIALVVRRLLAKSDEYESDRKPTLLDLWTRGSGGDAGPGG